jgi:hypothetical protein
VWLAQGGVLMQSSEFELGAVLGRGSVGQVYKALHRPSQRTVAVKVGLRAALLTWGFRSRDPICHSALRSALGFTVEFRSLLSALLNCYRPLNRNRDRMPTGAEPQSLPPDQVVRPDFTERTRQRNGTLEDMINEVLFPNHPAG